MTTRPYTHPDAVRLVRALYDEQCDRYGYADPAEADPQGYAPPAGLFVVAYVNEMPVACGGYRAHHLVDGCVEIKKMYTDPQYRGHGIAGQLLAELECQAARHGTSHAILETGIRNKEALALYWNANYRSTAGYVQGRDPAINRAFIKRLTKPPESFRR